jgi:hypothetical protein
MATKTSELAREVESLRDRVDRLEGHLLSGPARLATPTPVLQEHFVPLIAHLPDVIGVAVEEDLDGWRVWTFLAGWDRGQEKAIYAAEYETLRALEGSLAVRFLLEPESTPQGFEARAAEMAVLFRRPGGGPRAQQAGASRTSKAR